VPHHRIVTLRVGGHEIKDITVALNIIPIPEDHRQFPGAGSGMTIELPAVQRIMDLVADGEVSAEEVRTAPHRVAAKLHDGNDEFRGMEEVFELP
jgi:hypothetical protein